jgi:SAM-dependent methyltransferase
MLSNSSELGGYVDVISPKQVSGWAVDLQHPEKPVVLSLFVNGFLVKTVRCGETRQDAVQAGFSGARGFFFNPIRSLSNGRNQIQVKFAVSGQVMPGGEMLLEYDRAQHIGEYWSSVYQDQEHLLLRWWQCEKIVKHINERVCGVPIPGLSAGLYHRIKQRFSERLPLGRAISVGCGTASKEIDCMREGIVEGFDLYELSEIAIQRGTELVRNAGLVDRMRFHAADAFQVPNLDGSYDMVFWNNSLHHMFDVDAAIRWSRDVLKAGGLFVMDDFVGATQFQWSDRLSAINTQVRKELPAEYLRDPKNPGQFLSAMVGRPNLDTFAATDPSECRDSGRILPCLKKYFPDADVVLTGGGIYHLALNDVLHNILAARDEATLDRLLELDDACIALGETRYAVAIAVKV